MKITIEPTEERERTTNNFYTTVQVSQATDELDIHQAAQLIRSALLAWGFHSDNVDIYIEAE